MGCCDSYLLSAPPVSEVSDGGLFASVPVATKAGMLSSAHWVCCFPRLIPGSFPPAYSRGRGGGVLSAAGNTLAPSTSHWMTWQQGAPWSPSPLPPLYPARMVCVSSSVLFMHCACSRHRTLHLNLLATVSSSPGPRADQSQGLARQLAHSRGSVCMLKEMLMHRVGWHSLGRHFVYVRVSKVFK